MNQNKVKAEKEKFVVERECDAPVEKVYAAWTDPDKFAKWFGPKGATVAHLSMNLEPQGTTLYCLKMGNGFEYWGKFIYTEIIPNEKLVFLNSITDSEGTPAKMPNNKDWPLELITTLIFEVIGDRTRLTLTAEPYEATIDEKAGFEKGKDSMNKGWAGSFQQLDEILG